MTQRSLDDLTEEMADWIKWILPARDPFDTAIKLVEETSELLHALHHDEGNVAEECADILVLLLDVALLTGVDLQAAFEEKMEINRNRTWKLKQGCLTHETNR